MVPAGVNSMNILNISALTIGGLVTCVLLLMPDPSKNATLTGPSQIDFQDSTAIARQNIAVSHGNPLDESLLDSIQPTKARQKPAENREVEVDAPATDWPKMLYPELDRIAELENESVDAALVELSPMLYDEDPVIRLAAIKSLGDMTNETALSVLSSALDDPDPQLRIAVLEALSAQGNKSVSASIEPYLHDFDVDVRVAAIVALADLKADGADHALAGLLSDPDAQIRIHAVYALGEIGGPNALLYLQQVSYDPVAAIRANADAIIAELEYDAAN